MKQLLSVSVLLVLSSSAFAASTLCQEKALKVAQVIAENDQQMSQVSKINLSEALITDQGLLVIADGQVQDSGAYKGLEIDIKTNDSCDISSISVSRGTR